MKVKRFLIELHDYTPGVEPDKLTAGRIEHLLERVIAKDESDGYAMVTELEGDATTER